MIYPRCIDKRCILNCSQRDLDWIEGENCSVNHDISDGFRHTALDDSFGDIFTSEIYHWRKPLKCYLSIVKSTSWPHIYKRLWFSSWQQLRNASHNYDLSGSIAWQIFGLIWGWFLILKIYDTIYSTSVDCTSFWVLLQSSILCGHHLGNIHLSAKKGKRKWSYRSVSYSSIERSRAFGEQLMATQSKAAQT